MKNGVKLVNLLGVVCMLHCTKGTSPSSALSGMDILAIMGDDAVL
jgi:hypothetical protein